MWDNVYSTVRHYLAFYGDYFSTKWNEMGPMGYGILLIGIGIFGWLLMKSGVKGPGS